jgi:type II secretory pathway pseudopilin PulG
MPGRDAAIEVHARPGNHPRPREIRVFMKARRSSISALAVAIAALLFALLGVAIVVFLSALLFSTAKGAQDEGHESDPASALSAALSAACRANETQFANYLTADTAAAFRALPSEQRTAFLKRFSLADGPGKPLLSSDPQNHTVLRCVASEGTAEFRFGDVRTRENLAFIPVSVVDGPQSQFGLVRENGGWRLLSLGLVLLDIPQLSKQWAEGDLAAREDSAVATLRHLAEAIRAYRDAYGKLPDSLAQLGPAPKGEISPDQASLVDEHLAAGSAGGYQFHYRVVSSAGQDDPAFELVATPGDYGKAGRRSFFLDAAGKLHGADRHGALATADDPVVSDAQSN